MHVNDKDTVTSGQVLGLASFQDCEKNSVCAFECLFACVFMCRRVCLCWLMGLFSTIFRGKCILMYPQRILYVPDIFCLSFNATPLSSFMCQSSVLELFQ